MQNRLRNKPICNNGLSKMVWTLSKARSYVGWPTQHSPTPVHQILEKNTTKTYLHTQYILANETVSWEICSFFTWSFLCHSCLFPLFHRCWVLYFQQYDEQNYLKFVCSFVLRVHIWFYHFDNCANHYIGEGCFLFSQSVVQRGSMNKIRTKSIAVLSCCACAVNKDHHSLEVCHRRK